MTSSATSEGEPSIGICRGHESIGLRSSPALRFAWVSSFGTDFNYDYRTSITPEEMAKSKVEYNFDLVEFPSAE